MILESKNAYEGSDDVAQVMKRGYRDDRGLFWPKGTVFRPIGEGMRDGAPCYVAEIQGLIVIFTESTK